MILTKTIKVKWNGLNKKHYEEKGYTFTKINDEFQVKVEDLSHGSHVKIDIKCDCEDCKEPFMNVYWQNYLRCMKDDGKYYCRKCSMKLFGNENIRKSVTKLKNSKSFEQWCIDNDRQDILDRWDYELNKYKPSELSYSTMNKVWIKCPRNLHESELKALNNFTRGSEGVMDCLKCKSFAQRNIDKYGEDFLEKYWDYEKNTVNPWDIRYAGNTKVWIKCQEKDYHNYDIRCSDFNSGYRCGYCANAKVHPSDSIGQYLNNNNLLYLWSEKNKKLPYEFALKSHKKVFWKCPFGKHNDYKRSVDGTMSSEFRCPECNMSKGEKRIADYFLLNNIPYEMFKSFDGLIGLGGGYLSYDFYLPQYNLLIEFQGGQHEKFTKGIHNTIDDFNKQLIHDDLKRDYAKSNGFMLLEIWHWDIENVEEILRKELNLK